ncbi:hypothetical protein MAIC_47020 [Mycolicibacterium aichiense]|uniref:Uncharacterized protein n=1 Tax=Mycolicibacterium aichiense TaxID=1799 RepID=A0AAD1HR61_9MYCO|nr:hypothetical protein MAIC_47020 [Mycolicibacterium aichiense]
MRYCCTEAPDASAPTVVQARFVQPLTGSIHSVPAGTTEGLGVIEEPHGNAGEAIDLTGGAGLTGRDDEHAGHVVSAIAVLGPRFVKTRMLKGPAMVRHPK